MPENLHLIHGDIHIKNVMLSDGEPMLNDMDTLSVRDPVFGFAGLITAYELYNDDDHDNAMKFMGIPWELSRSVWKTLLTYYLDSPDTDTLAAAMDKVRVVGNLRFLNLVYAQHIGDEHLRMIRTDHAIRNLTELLPRVDDLTLS